MTHEHLAVRLESRPLGNPKPVTGTIDVTVEAKKIITLRLTVS